MPSYKSEEMHSPFFCTVGLEGLVCLMLDEKSLPPTIISRTLFYIVISLWIREKLPTDPVCGAVLDERTSKYKITYEGDTYHFCSVTCKKRFKRHPMKFLK